MMTANVSAAALARKSAVNKFIDWMIKLGGFVLLAGLLGFLITQLIVFVVLCRGG